MNRKRRKRKPKSESEIKLHARIIAQYPEMAGKSKRQRIKEYIESIEPFTEDGAKMISESAFNLFRYVHPNLCLGGLEDCSEEQIMSVANSLGYKCHRSNFGGIMLRPKRD